MLKRFPRLYFLLALVGVAHASAHHPALPQIPAEIASHQFVVTIDGHSTPVNHAALNLYFLNFEARKHATIQVTAPTDDFWAAGVEVQPWRLNIRPKREGRTLTFKLDGPAKISISRPGDFLTDATMLFLFANPPERNPPTAPAPSRQYFGPGVHRENIDAHTGDTIYLAPGAVVFGSLNLWRVDHVKVFGRGVIVYDGPQNPADDDGWMHKRNWHCIVMDNAHDISIEGITCVVRSRTWQIQMKDSRNILFDNIKVIGANAGNANADGMDWLGGGDTIVRNSFFRAADDIFAMQSSWEGYGPVAFAVQGKPVTNITVKDSVLSTSVSNIVRAGWPQKNFEGGNFLLRNSDVLHAGFGGCGVPFALMELWADPAGRGESSGFHFDSIRMEDWYSLFNLRQSKAGNLLDVTFTDIAGLETPSLVASALKGNIEDVAVDNLVTAGTLATSAAAVPVTVEANTPSPIIHNTGPAAHILVRRGLIRPHDKVHFEAVPDASDTRHLHYTWLFGDGKQATGRKVKHRFPDTEGTLRDRSGRFRILLHITVDGIPPSTERNTWIEQPIVVADALQPALTPRRGQPGISYQIGAGPTGGTVSSFALDQIKQLPSHYTLTLEGDLTVPDDGAYAFLVIANEAASMELDGRQAASAPAPFPQLCGLAGSAARPISVSAALARGRHHIKITETHTAGVDNFRVLWQGAQPLAPIPSNLLSH